MKRKRREHAEADRRLEGDPCPAIRAVQEDRAGHSFFDIKNRAIAAKMITAQTTMVTRCVPGPWAFGLASGAGTSVSAVATAAVPASGRVSV